MGLYAQTSYTICRTEVGRAEKRHIASCKGSNSGDIRS